MRVDHSTLNRWVLEYSPELEKHTLEGFEAMNMLRKG